MADEDYHKILDDLRQHLKNAKIPAEKASTLVENGNEQLVVDFLAENISIEGSGPEAIQSQLYIASFWGLKDIVSKLLTKGADVNKQNRGTLWTPLHAAAFQEHGPVVMILLEYGSKPELPDAEGRTPKDFASASDKIWPHFAALKLERTSRHELVQKRVMQKVDVQAQRHSASGMRMGNNSGSAPSHGRGDDYYPRGMPNGGDVLADPPPQQPGNPYWR